MVVVFVLPPIILITLYLVLRLLRNTSMERRLTPAELLFAGIFCWGMILFWCGWFGILLFGVYLLLQGESGGFFLLTFMAFMMGLIYRFSQILDSYQLFDFIRTAMWFQPYASQPFVILDEVDKKKIQQIHRETSGTPFPTAEPEKVLKTKGEVLKIQQELFAFQQKPKNPLLLDDEMKELKAGHRVDISESWKLHVLTRTTHELYEEIESMDLDPSTTILTFQVRIRSAMQNQLNDPNLVFSIKQDLYDLLQAVHTESWMRPYRPYYRALSVFCIGMMLDDYGRENPYIFMHLEITVLELERRAGKFFNTKEFDTIARITFLDGAPIL